MPIPKLVVTAALMVAQTALTMSRKIKGPRLDETKVSTADYGTPLPRFWGVRRFEASIYWAEELREEKTTTKTKSGKYEGYKYYATFGIVVADQAIDDVTRIWMDRRLVYDKTHAGPISLASVAGFDVSNGMRVYLGTEDQMPDPAYVAWCEDRYGVDSAPAYRGVSHVVFEDLPVEDFGNRVPQISVEAVSVKTAAYPYETRTSEFVDTSERFYFSHSGTWMANSKNYGALEWWDIPSRTKIGVSPTTGTMVGSLVTDVTTDGTAYQVGDIQEGVDAVPYFFVTQPLGAPVATLISDFNQRLFDRLRVLGSSVYTMYDSAAGYLLGPAGVSHTQSLRDVWIDADGDHWGLFQPTGTSSDFTLENLSSGTSYTFTGSASRSGPGSARGCHVPGSGHHFVNTDGYFYLIDDSAFTVSVSGAQGWTGAATVDGHSTGQTSFWTLEGASYAEWSLADGSQIRTLAASLWSGAGTALRWAYDPVNHAIWAQNHPVGADSSEVIIRYLDRVASNGVTLQTIVDDVCGWCGIAA